jgi:ABC-type nitrate/sulfonate/bicarbonate transport system substrate-binding protein
MGQALIKMNATPTGMRLNEWVAMEEGLFANEGLDVKVDWEVLHRQQARQGTAADKDMPRAQDLRLGKFLPNSEVTSACGWGSLCMAGAGMGKFLKEVHGMSPCGIFVRADSKIRRPEELKNVPIGVGLRAGSHFSLYHVMEKHLPLEEINAVNVGGFGARLEALLKGTVEAANLLPPQIYMAKQLGLREVAGGEFPVIWWVQDNTDPDKVSRYLRAIAAAEKLLQQDLKKYLHLWKYSIPREFEDRTWDYAKFGRGERYIDSPISEQAFDTMMEASARWKLDNHVTNRSFESLAFQAA